jgi:UDP:flavonoid glycosyltransferase YjiC (YdhE family)
VRIALATVGTTGDVIPFRALGRRLVAAGHEVTIVTWPVHQETLGIPGARVVAAGPQADRARITAVAAAAARQGPMEQVATLRDFHLGDGEAHYRRLRAVLPGHDLVLLHGIHALAHAAALDEGLPWATVTFDPVLLPTRAAPPPGMPGLGPANRLLWRILDCALARLGRPLDELLARAGSDQRGLPLFRARSPLLHLVACSPSIIVTPPDLPGTTRITGAWVDEAPPPPLPRELKSFLEDGPQPVVITFGSMAGISASELDLAVGLLLDGGRRVVVQAPCGLASPNLVEIGPVDHRALFRRAAVVVHHGGAGTTHAACAAGVPSVVVPQVGDQRYWAGRLRRLGVAPEPVNAGTDSGRRVAEAALAVAADPARHVAAGALADRLAAEDGVAASVTLLEATAR